MIKSIAIGLLLALLLPLAAKTVIVAHYWFNFQYYAEVLCENKDKPMMHCNGSCALSKELKAASEAKSNAEKRIPELSELRLSVFTTAHPLEIKPLLFSTIDYSLTEKTEPIHQGFRASLLIPPCI